MKTAPLGAVFLWDMLFFLTTFYLVVYAIYCSFIIMGDFNEETN